MEPYQQRVMVEKAELDEKINALHRFMVTPTFETLLPEDALLLQIQCNAMVTYSRILGQRIARFPDPRETSHERAGVHRNGDPV